MGGIGKAHRAGFEIQLKLQGHTTFAHNNFGTPEVETFEARAIKDNRDGNKRQIVFNFGKQEEIYPGMVLQVKGSRDFWKVTDTEDVIEDDTYIYFEVWVEKINDQGSNMRLNEQGKAVFYGNVTGGVQIGGQNNTQTVTFTNNVNPDFAEAVKALTDLVIKSDLHDLEKEERLAEIERIKQLAQKEQTTEVKQLGQSKIKLLETGLKAGELLLKAAPFVGVISKAFGG